MGRLPGGPAAPGGVHRPGARTAAGRVRRPARLARDDPVLYRGATPTRSTRSSTSRRGSEAAARAAGRSRGAAAEAARGGARAHRPGRDRPVRADHARRLAAGQGGAAARLPAVARRGRGVAAAGARRRDRRAGRRADRPVPVLRGGLAARRQGVLLRAAAAAGRGARRGEPVSPAGVPARGGDAAGVGRGGVRRGAGQDHVLFGQRQHGRALAADRRRHRHGAPQGPLDRRPDHVRPGDTGAGPAHGRARRAGLAPGGPRRAAVRVHRPGRAARADLRRRPGRARARRLAGPDPGGPVGGAARLRDPRRASPAGAGRLPHPARDQRGHHARPRHRRAADHAGPAGDRLRRRGHRAAGGRARGVVRLHGLHDAAGGAALRRRDRRGGDLGDVPGLGRQPAGGDRLAGHVPLRGRHASADGDLQPAGGATARSERNQRSCMATAGSTSA